MERACCNVASHCYRTHGINPLFTYGENMIYPFLLLFSGKSHAKFTMEKRAEIIYEATQMFPMLFFRVVESTRTTHAK